MRIPDVQKRLAQLATERGIPELADLARQLARRKASRRAPRCSARITDAMRSAIRAFASEHPNMTQAEIGRHFDVNPGRVSEAMAGFRR